MPYDHPIPGESKSETWAETLALFPHPNLKVSEHAVCNDVEALEPRRDPTAVVLADGAALPPAGAVREVSVKCVNHEAGDS